MYKNTIANVHTYVVRISLNYTLFMYVGEAESKRKQESGKLNISQTAVIGSKQIFNHSTMYD